jgi:hypothetical protein
MAQTTGDIPSEIKNEIGLIAWKELAHFFAQGAAVAINIELDLADVALQFTRNNTTAVSTWMQEGKVAKVSDDLARAWFDADATVRAIVVSPWVLVQAAEARN